MAGLKADGVEFDPVKVEGMLFDIEAGIVRSQILAASPHRRPRHPHRAPDRNPQQRAAPHPRFGPVHARRNPGAGRDHAGHRRDAQRIDALAGEYEDRFMLHYNMPPFATGEVGRMGSTKRREIGHGRLAKRALVAVLPSQGRVPLHHARGVRKSPSPTAPRRWLRCAAAACR